MSLSFDWRWIIRGLGLGLLAFAIFGPLFNLLLWTIAERWYFPHTFPSQYGFSFWANVFSARGGALNALFTSIFVALLTVIVSVGIAIPAGYALARLALPCRSLIMLLLLIPQAFPNLPVYVNIAQIFYSFSLNGTLLGVVLVHVTHGLVYAVWIVTAAFASVDRQQEEAARSLGASGLRTFFDITLPASAGGLLASSIFVFLESLDEFTGTFFVGAPDISTLPLLLYTAASGGNYQIASITALILLIPSIGFMFIIERFLKADVLAKMGR